jgi:hypothetical protein
MIANPTSPVIGHSAQAAHARGTRAVRKSGAPDQRGLLNHKQVAQQQAMLSRSEYAQHVPADVPSRLRFLGEMDMLAHCPPERFRSRLAEHIALSLRRARLEAGAKRSPEAWGQHLNVWHVLFERDYSHFTEYRDLLSHLRSPAAGCMTLASAVKIAVHVRPDLVAAHFDVVG